MESIDSHRLPTAPPLTVTRERESREAETRTGRRHGRRLRGKLCSPPRLSVSVVASSPSSARPPVCALSLGRRSRRRNQSPARGIAAACAPHLHRSTAPRPWPPPSFSVQGFSPERISMENEHSTNDDPRKIPYKLIKQITNDLAKERIVGSGAFGTVYRGVYENGEEIAIKILRNMSGFDMKEFHKEFRNLRDLKHQNVVELVGFCKEEEQVLADYEGKQVLATQIYTALCFEFVQNGSLQKHITDECTGLNWIKRYKIIKGICQGLQYLREGLKTPVMHLDLKPDNILLDEAMVPKIADFGLSRLFGEEKTRMTISSVGTFGYMPPEFIKHQVISDTFDIFSLGVIITKIITGHKGYESIADMSPAKFVKQVHDKWRKELVKILKPRPLEVYCHQVKRCTEIALECIKTKRQERPPIQCVVSALLDTETMIQHQDLQEDQFPDEESIHTETYVAERQLSGMSDHSTRPILPVELTYDFLAKITNKFSDERKLGADAFGVNYMGTLDDGVITTVKKLVHDAPVAPRKVFFKEVSNIMALKHENIVEIHAYCSEVSKILVQVGGRYIQSDVEDFILCYEYLPKGTLQKNLFEAGSSMNWDTRFRIIKGICRGLHFLHHLDLPIVHMNLNLESIYLDGKMNPKIGCFSMSRVFGQEQTRICTQNVVGIRGYMPPEYLYRGEISGQSDVYSLGIIIMEIVTGQKNSPVSDDPSARRFIANVEDEWTEEHIERVYSADCLQQVIACISLARECVEIDRRQRPSIDRLVEMIKRPITIIPPRRTTFEQPPQRTTFEQPPQLNFLLEPNRLTSRSLYLTNSTNSHIAFMLATDTPRSFLTKLPLCGIVPPNCTYTVCVTMSEHEKAPPSNSNKFLTLRSRNEPNVEGGVFRWAGDEFFKRGDDVVQELKVAVSYKQPAWRSIFRRKEKNDLIQRQIEIVDGPNYRLVSSVDIHSTEPWILTSNERGYVCIWNYQTQAEVHCFEVSREEPVYSAKFIEREEWLVVGGGDGYIYVYSYDKMEEVTSVAAHGGRRPVTSLAVHPTQSLVLSASDDDLIKLWDWKNGWKCTRTFEWHNNRVTQVMFDPNDIDSFASTSLDGTVKIWNISSGMCIITLHGHPDGLHCLHYVTGDNRSLLVTGSSDGAAKVWDLETDSCVDTLNGHANHLTALWWHPEVPVLMTGSADGTVQFWKFTDNKYRLESVIGFNLGSVNDLGYMKTLRRIVVGCKQGVVMMEVNLP